MANILILTSNSSESLVQTVGKVKYFTKKLAEHNLCLYRGDNLIRDAKGSMSRIISEADIYYVYNPEPYELLNNICWYFKPKTELKDKTLLMLQKIPPEMEEQSFNHMVDRFVSPEQLIELVGDTTLTGEQLKKQLICDRFHDVSPGY